MRSNLHRFVLLLTLLLGAAWTAPLRAQEAYAVLDDAGTLTFYYDGQKATRTGTQKWDVPVNSSFANTPGWAGTWENPNRTVKAVDFSASFAAFEGITSLSGWFYNCTALTEVRHPENLNTDSVTNMSGMFCGCSSLQTLDLSGWNTAKVTDMRWMFQSCSALTSLDLSGWKTENVTDMGAMFYGCSALECLDLLGWKTGSVTDMSGMFANCSALETIACPATWTCSGNSGYMFYGCTALRGAVEYDENKIDVTMANPGNGYFYRTLEDGIHAPVAENAGDEEATYNLAGQRVKRDYRGITVRKGKKMLTR